MTQSDVMGTARRIVFWFFLFFWIYAPLVRGQSVQDTLTALRAEYPSHMTAAQTAELLGRVATLHPGWGVHRKSSGEICPLPDGRTINCGLLVSPTLGVYDVLGHAAGDGPNSFPQWAYLGQIDEPANVLVPNVGTPVPNPGTTELRELYELLSADVNELRAQLDAVREAVYTQRVDMVDRIGLETEARVSADEEIRSRLTVLEAREVPARCIARVMGIPIACRLEP